MDLFVADPSIYQTYFRENHLRLTGTTELEKDAELAIHLITFLRNCQDSREGCWSDRDLRSTMRDTCHALEALHLLDLPSYTQENLTAGAAWLANLSMDDGSDDPVEGLEASRWHPSRFKTLAWLRSFETPVVRDDFAKLSQHVDPSGYLRNVHNRHLLATLIYLDTLYHLAQSVPLPEVWQRSQMRALGVIHREVETWFHDPSTAEPFVSGQELSYALDILLTYQVLDHDHAIIEAIRQGLARDLHTADTAALLTQESLYSAIQLSRHFRQHGETERVLRPLRSALRLAYEGRHELALKQDFPFHPLVLRLLISYHGLHLRDAIVQQLFRTHEEQVRQVQGARKAEVHKDLQDILHQLVQVAIINTKTLSGGMRADKVYAAEFEVILQTPENHALTPAFRSDRQSLVVKMGPLLDLRRSIDRYKKLPGSIRSLFAAHAHDPQMVRTVNGDTGYLIMQDLLHMQTLDDFLDGLDRPVLAARQRQVLEKAAAQVVAALHQIHVAQLTSQEQYAGDQLARLYFARLEHNVLALTQKYPRLKPELRRLAFNGRRYKALNYYVGVLQGRSSRLRPSTLGLVHGDCNTRNIMLDDEGQRVMFIDLDRVETSGDYIDDFALLLEDACVNRYLDSHDRNGYVRPGDIVECEMPDGALGWECTRPLFRQPLLERFQRVVLDLLPTHAAAMKGDTNWQPRLWLATAVRLLRLSSLVNAEPYALLLYAEAIRLLDTLCQALVKGEDLPDLLFAEPELVKPPASDYAATLLAAIQAVYPISGKRPSTGRYEFRDAAGQLRGLLLGGEWPWRLAVSASPESLRAIVPQAESYRSGTLLGVVALPDDPAAAASLALACLQHVLP